MSSQKHNFRVGDRARTVTIDEFIVLHPDADLEGCPYNYEFTIMESADPNCVNSPWGLIHHELVRPLCNYTAELPKQEIVINLREWRFFDTLTISLPYGDIVSGKGTISIGDDLPSLPKVHMAESEEDNNSCCPEEGYSPGICMPAKCKPSYGWFKKKMKVLRKSIKLITFLEKGIQAFDAGNGRPDFGGHLLDEYVDMLAEITGDERESISAFIWDDNWGKKAQVKSIKQLYKTIINGK